jgi:hypothetical protein
MAGGTRLGVLPPERAGIETGAVRVEASSPQRRMAGETISLGMAGNTALQVLPSGLPVIQEEGLLRIMKPDAPKPTGRDQSRADMAVGAELGLVVALITRAFPTVRCGGMGGEKARRMVPRRCIGRPGTVALETRRSNVAGGAGLGPRGSGSRVALGEVQAMRFRSRPLDPGPLASSGSRGWNRLDVGRGAYMAGQAAFLGMTAGATGRTLAHLSSVLAEEARVGMARRCLELRPDR